MVLDYSLRRRVTALETMSQQVAVPVAGDFAKLGGGPVKGPIFCTTDNAMYYLLADGVTVKKTAALV